MSELTRPSNYRRALVRMKQRIQTSRSCAVIAADAALLIQPMVEEIGSELIEGHGGLPKND